MDEILEVDGVNETPEEVKAPHIGQFKTKDKFIEFVGGKGNVNFFTDEAFVESKYLSGSLSNDVKFKLTICDEGTVDFDEVDTNFTTPDERKRLLDLISDKTLVPSRIKNHFIVSEVPFTATKQINGRDMSVYLAVDYQTPIAKLASIFDDEEVEINDQQDSNLDKLLSMFDDEEPSLVEATQEETEVETEDVPSDVETKSESQKMVEDSFRKMKEEKVEELKRKIEHQQKEMFRFESEKRSAERKLEEAKSDIKLLESRLDTLIPNAEPNGYIFFVSEELNQKVNLPADIEALIREKVAKVKGINIEGFMKLFEGGEYQIRLGKIETDETFGDHPVEVTDYENLPKEIQDKLDFLHLQEGKLIHHGDLKWHDLIQKMLKLGFEQSSDFDKMCGSGSFGSGTNTYQPRNESETEEVVVDEMDSYKKSIEEMAKGLGVSVNFGEDGISLEPNSDPNENLIELRDQKEEKDLVIYGWTFDGEKGVEITDDYTSFSIKVGNDNPIYLESDGFANITTVDQFLKMLNESDLDIEDIFGATDAVYVPGFKGQIKLGVFDDDGKLIPTTEYDLNDYIHHQLEDGGDVTIFLPENTKVTKINEKNLKSLIRDGKLDNILK